ncbi:MAG: hypothetical protein H0T04_01210 [Chloroflexi bacterium]|nr:hypothetical protein [Chloroflexota bacterium]MBA3851622.1 hypothetical protein [Chloroflexota bacterium]MDQ3407928.1 hypothetical protein [Chloroflexota bacterium]
MDDTRRSDDPAVGDDMEAEERHATPFGLESSIPGVSVHGAEDAQERAPSIKGSEESGSDDEAPPLV